MTLQAKSFENHYQLCRFVNERKVKVEQVCVMYNLFYLFYWEEEND